MKSKEKEQLLKKLTNIADEYIGKDEISVYINDEPETSIACTDGKYIVELSEEVFDCKEHVISTFLHELGHILDENDDTFGKWDILYKEIAAWNIAINLANIEEIIELDILLKYREKYLNSYLEHINTL